ncbi:MAG: hypothetical protein JO067_04195 [Cupriavidus sp.]|nr:hypothetical protein [Cupriavidus sp.]
MKTAAWISNLFAELSRKAAPVLRFLKICFLIGTQTRTTADRLARGDRRFGLGPKTVATIGLTICFAASILNPSSSQKAGWIDGFIEMSTGDQVHFLDLFGLSADDAIRDARIEILWRGISRSSSQIASLAGSTSNSDITIFIAKFDPALAKTFSKSIELEGVKIHIFSSVLQAVLLPAMALSAVIYHAVSKPSAVPRRTTVNLTLYFSGYYYLVWALFITLRYPIYFQKGILVVPMLIMEFAIIILLIIQYCIFLNWVHRNSLGRVVAAVSTSSLIFMVIYACYVWMFVTLVEIPFVERLIGKLS